MSNLDPCRDVKCGPHAYCKSEGQEAYCICEDGWTFNPGDISAGCIGEFSFPFRRCVRENIFKRFRSLGTTTCSRNPCGQNTRCKDVEGGYKCTCLPGCTGDPLKGCLCEALRTDYCKNLICGTNALCRLHNDRDPQCYCPPEFPVGDPNVLCEYINHEFYARLLATRC